MRAPTNHPPQLNDFVNGRILAIDDTQSIHEDYRKVLLRKKPTSTSSMTYQIDSALQGEEGLELVKQSLAYNAPYATAFIDIRMPPGWDGIETAQKIWEVDPDLPIVLCTAHSDYSWDIIQTKLGRTDQLLILKKPFEPIELLQIAAVQVARWHLNNQSQQNTQDLEAIVETRMQEIARTRDVVFFTLARLAESRDPETGEHLNRIQGYTHILTNALAAKNLDGYQLDDRAVTKIARSSILHDIGKVGIPDSILLKPGKLTPDEFEVMKQHSVIGAEALEDACNESECCEFLKTAAEIARHHHEKYDGTGYPSGLSGTSIPLAARIVAIADVFDALTSERVYKKAMSAEDARELIESEAGRHFDPVIISVFTETWDQFIELSAESHAQTERFLEIST